MKNKLYYLDRSIKRRNARTTVEFLKIIIVILSILLIISIAI